MTFDSRASSVRRSIALRRALVVGCLLVTGPGTAADRIATATNTTVTAIAETQRVQAVVDEFRVRLKLPTAVTASIVAENPLLVSVSPPRDAAGAFRLAFEAGFLDQLSEDDLKAVVAHELGHVWIFTHHPYLQTEAGANRIAERLVTRESLERVYTKVWPQGAPSNVTARFTER